MVNPEVQNWRRPSYPEAGDVWVYAAVDTNLPSNYTGLPGFIVAVVYDGKRWCRMTRKFLESIGLGDTTYHYRYETLALKACFAKRIEQFIQSNPGLEFIYWPYKGKWYAKPVASTLTQSDSVT